MLHTYCNAQPQTAVIIHESVHKGYLVQWNMIM